MNTFLKLLTVQMSSQDPLNPVSNTEFFGQLAQLGQVQGLDALKKSSDISQATAMIGKTVTAVRPMTNGYTGTNDIVIGVVKTLSIRNGNYYLELKTPDGGNAEVQMGNIQSVSQTS